MGMLLGPGGAGTASSPKAVARIHRGERGGEVAGRGSQLMDENLRP